MPDNKEIPNQNTLFSSSGPPHSPPKPAEPTKGADTKAPSAADAKKPTEPAKAPDAKSTPAADAKKPVEPAKAPDATAQRLHGTMRCPAIWYFTRRIPMWALWAAGTKMETCSLSTVPAAITMW